MLQYIPVEITLGSFSLIGVLTAYIWNTQNKQIKDLQETQKQRPCNLIEIEITQIKTDVKWIKKNIEKLKW